MNFNHCGMSVILAFVSISASANPSEFALRMGPLYESLSGPIRTNKLITTTIEAEYSLFLTNTNAIFFRYTLANELPSSKPYHFGIGVGPRFFFNSKGHRNDVEENGIRLSIVPDWRYFFGVDAGISQVIVKSFGSVLQANSTNATATAHLGASKQISERFNINGIVGIGMGYGFSSLSIIEISPRAFIGLGYGF
jgi:hypothetical protein